MNISAVLRQSMTANESQMRTVVEYYLKKRKHRDVVINLHGTYQRGTPLHEIYYNRHFTLLKQAFSHAKTWLLANGH